MAEKKPEEARDHEFAEIAGGEGPASLHLSQDDLGEVVLNVAADLGRRKMLVREVLNLKRGSVVALDRLAGEMTDILVNGLPLARGEVVVIGDTLHVRISEVIGAAEIKGEDSDA
jgi:flagellar motor switch protein FliN/FliY